jgi:hypothetical protein
MLIFLILPQNEITNALVVDETRHGCIYSSPSSATRVVPEKTTFGKTKGNGKFEGRGAAVFVHIHRSLIKLFFMKQKRYLIMSFKLYIKSDRIITAMKLLVL